VRWGLGFSWALGEVLAHGHYWDRNGRRTDGAVEGSGADFWLYVAADETSAARCKEGIAVSLQAHGSRIAILPRVARDTAAPLQWEQGKETQKMVRFFRKGVPIIRPARASGTAKRGPSFGFRRLPSPSVGLGGGLIFFHGVLADCHHLQGRHGPPFLLPPPLGAMADKSLSESYGGQAAQKSRMRDRRFAGLAGEILAKRKGDLMT
jgi:hypothetical protein